MTTRETLLHVAATLPQPFSTEELAVAAWKADSKAFGLPGFEALYPDKARLRNCLYDRHGLLTRGWIVKDGLRFRVVKMPTMSSEPTPSSVRLSARLVRAADTGIYLAYKAGKKEAINFRDALHFWGLSPTARPDAIRAAVAEFANLLRDRETPELRALGACHDFLTGTFARQLKRAG